MRGNIQGQDDCWLIEGMIVHEVEEHLQCGVVWMSTMGGASVHGGEDSVLWSGISKGKRIFLEGKGNICQGEYLREDEHWWRGRWLLIKGGDDRPWSGRASSMRGREGKRIICQGEDLRKEEHWWRGRWLLIKGGDVRPWSGRACSMRSRMDVHNEGKSASVCPLWWRRCSVKWNIKREENLSMRGRGISVKGKV